MKSVDLKIEKMLKLRKQGEWLAFMEFVSNEIPFLLQSGRPARHEVQYSLIGQAGHNTWEQFCVDKLKWSKAGWHSWTQAYRMVLEYPYLRESGASASLINVRRRQLSKFPKTLNDWQQVSREKLATNRQSKTAQLEKRIAELEHIVKQFLDKERR